MQRVSAQHHQETLKNLNLEMSLREHLLAASASGSGPLPYPASTAPPPNSEQPYQPSDSASPHDQYDHNAGASQQYGMSGDSAGDDGLSPDARKGKRELSTSKRAAQDRAAQRAFRQRKEGYIKKLEEQVKEFQTMEQNFRALQNENYQLREYILNLQSRLLENQSDFPPAPSHVNIQSSAQQGSGGTDSAVEQQLRREMQHQPPPEAPMRHDAMSQLQAAAAQASEVRPQDPPYGMGGEHPSKRVRAGEDAPSGEAKANA